jgi:NitT/TauT family transport system permease protein
MNASERRSIVVVTPGLDCADQVVQALQERYEVIPLTSMAELQTLLRTTEEPHAIVMSADLRSREADANPADRQRLEHIFSGKTSVPIVMVARTRENPAARAKPGSIVTRSRIQFLASPFEDHELLELIDFDLAQKTYRRRRMLRSVAPPIFVFLLFLLAWEAGCRLLGIREFVLPPPTKIFAVAMKNASSLLFDTGLTTLEAVLGFLLANVLSMLLAVCFCHSRWMETSLYPYTIALKSVPIVAVAPLLVLWFGYGLWGKVVMASTVAFFPLVVNATLGLKAVNSESLDLMHSLSASKWQILMKLRFPTAVPYILSALKISSTMAVVGAIVGELAGARRGIGYLILVSSYNLDTPLLFAAITLASFIGIAFFAVVAVLEMLLTARYTHIPGKRSPT